MKNFECQRCGACCKQPGFVYLAHGDAERLAAALEIDVYHFTDTYCVLLDRQRLALKKRPDESCLFLHGDRCAVYDARPVQCRDFPKGWRTERSLSYCEGLRLEAM